MREGAPADGDVIASTRRWLERAVIGLSLCPFAKQPHQRGLIAYRVSAADSEDALIDDLRATLDALQAADPAQTETMLLIHPRVLADFADYNDFLGRAEALVDEMALDGIIQIASFHPDYQFAGTDVDDIGNHSNRSPYPLLHLLRESSIDRAIDSGIDVDAIPARNIDRLHALGIDGWQALWRDDPT